MTWINTGSHAFVPYVFRTIIKRDTIQPSRGP